MIRGQTHILYKGGEEVTRGTLKEIAATINRPYVTVSNWARSGIMSVDGYKTLSQEQDDATRELEVWRNEWDKTVERFRTK